jgi:hypothetical protein
MSGRTYRPRVCQGIEHVEYGFTVVGANASTPTMLAHGGDPNSSFVTLGRTGVGVYTIQTVDPFTSCVYAEAQPVINPATAKNWYVTEWPIIAQQANNTWLYTVNLFTSGGVALELTTAMFMRFTLVFRNSIGDP